MTKLLELAISSKNGFTFADENNGLFLDLWHQQGSSSISECYWSGQTEIREQNISSCHFTSSP